MKVTPKRLLCLILLVTVLGMLKWKPTPPARLQTLEFYFGNPSRGVSGGQINLHFQLQSDGRFKYLARYGRHPVDQGEVDPFVVQGMASALEKLGLSEKGQWPTLAPDDEIVHVSVSDGQEVVSGNWSDRSEQGRAAVALVERVPRFQKALLDARKLRAQGPPPY